MHGPCTAGRVTWSCWGQVRRLFRFQSFIPLNYGHGPPKVQASGTKGLKSLGCILFTLFASLARLPCFTKAILDSIVVSIPACHAGDRGSIPRRGGSTF
jgi:hypothetical protein